MRSFSSLCFHRSVDEIDWPGGPLAPVRPLEPGYPLVPARPCLPRGPVTGFRVGLAATALDVLRRVLVGNTVRRFLEVTGFGRALIVRRFVVGTLNPILRSNLICLGDCLLIALLFALVRRVRDFGGSRLDTCLKMLRDLGDTFLDIFLDFFLIRFNVFLKEKPKSPYWE
jgi:hypothetical protein